MANEQQSPQEKIKQALIKKALGYDCDEVIEEYVIDEDGNKHLSKKKVTKKHISPDIPAAKVLLEHFESQKENIYENMTDEQLENERLKLLNLLKIGGK